MSSFDIRIDADEDENFDPKFNIVADSGFHLKRNQTPLFAYDYLNLDHPEYSFHHEKFDQSDYRIYFSQVKKISQICIGDLMDNHRQKDHFKISLSPNRNEKVLLENAISRRLNDDQYPPFGHFHLYTPKEKIDGAKAPRIHFFLGRFCVMYILYYDPFHKVHNTKN